MNRALQSVLVMIVCLTGIVITTQPVSGSTKNIPSLYAKGPAAYYRPSYTHAKWVRFYSIHANAGRIAKGAYKPSPQGYHCVHADIDKVGVPLILKANGIQITCVTADMVKVGHKNAWRKRWGIELSWTAFKALRLDKSNYVLVYSP